MADQGWEQVAAEAERLCEAATKGPWFYVHGYGFNVASAWHGDGPPSADTDFVVRARTLVPELAAIVRQQAAEVARLRAVLSEVRAWRRAGVGLEPLPQTDAETLGARIDAALTPLAAGEAEGA